MTKGATASELIDRILRGIGSIAVHWNAAEVTVRMLARDLERSGIHLGLKPKPSVSEVERALARAASSTKLPAHLRAPIHHLGLFLGIVQKYRNFYVHEVTGTFGVSDDRQTAVAFTYGEQPGPDGLFRRFASVEAAELERVSEYCKQLGRFASDVDHIVLNLVPTDALPPLGVLPPLPPALVLPVSS